MNNQITLLDGKCQIHQNYKLYSKMLLKQFRNDY